MTQSQLDPHQHYGKAIVAEMAKGNRVVFPKIEQIHTSEFMGSMSVNMPDGRCLSATGNEKCNELVSILIDEGWAYVGHTDQSTEHFSAGASTYERVTFPDVPEVEALRLRVQELEAELRKHNERS